MVWKKNPPLFTVLQYFVMIIMAHLIHFFILCLSWWRHQMEACSALLAIRAGNSTVTGEFRAQRPVTRSFDVFLDLRLNMQLSKQSWGWLFETLSRSLWRECNEREITKTQPSFMYIHYLFYLFLLYYACPIPWQAFIKLIDDIEDLFAWWWSSIIIKRFSEHSIITEIENHL